MNQGPPGCECSVSSGGSGSGGVNFWSRLLREAQSGKQCPAHSQCNNCKCELASYHDTIAVEKRLNQLATTYPDLAKLYSIGKTVEGRNLTVIQISKGVQQVNIFIYILERQTR